MLLPHAASDQAVKNQGGGAGEFEGVTIVALDVFVANILVVEVEHSIGSLALWVPVRRGLLDIDSVSAVNVVGQDALFVVGDFELRKLTHLVTRAGERWRYCVICHGLLLSFSIVSPFKE